MAQNLSEGVKYDDLNRLTEVTTTVNGIALPAKTVGYDALGNITSKTGVGPYSYA